MQKKYRIKTIGLTMTCFLFLLGLFVFWQRTAPLEKKIEKEVNYIVNRVEKTSSFIGFFKKKAIIENHEKLMEKIEYSRRSPAINHGLLAIGKAAYEIKDYKLAIEILERIQWLRHKDAADKNYTLGLCYKNLYQLDRATKYMRKALSLCSRNAPEFRIYQSGFNSIQQEIKG